MAQWQVARDGVFDEAAEGVFLSSADNPIPPRGIANLGFSNTLRMGGGLTTVMFQGKLYYVPDSNTLADGQPHIRVWDGTTDSELWRVQGDCDAILSISLQLQATTNYLVVETLDDNASLIGRVFLVNIQTGNGIQVGGGPLPTGYVPYGHWLFANSILVVPTYTGSTSIPGRIYVTNLTLGQPGYNAWTLGYQVTSGDGDYGGFTGFDGNGWAAVEGQAGEFAAAAHMKSVNTTTGAIEFWGLHPASGGTAADGNAFLAWATFKGRGYGSYWNPDTTPISKIYRQYWTSPGDNGIEEVWSAGATVSLQKPIVALFSPDNLVLYALMGGAESDEAGLLVTDDGDVWTDVTSNLSAGCPAFINAAGGKIPAIRESV